MQYFRWVQSAVLGAAVGLAYEAATWYTNDHYPIHNLNPQPEAFWIDKVSYDIFAKLHRLRYLNPKAYRISLLKTDSLLILENALRTRAKPTLEDVIRAETTAEIALKNMNKLVKDVTDPQDTLEVEASARQLEHFLDIHVENIRQLCKDCIIV